MVGSGPSAADPQAFEGAVEAITRVLAEPWPATPEPSVYAEKAIDDLAEATRQLKPKTAKKNAGGRRTYARKSAKRQGGRK
jgi:hypothetical protein